MSREINSTGVVNAQDLRKVARRKVPRVIFDYLDGGAEAEITLRSLGKRGESRSRDHPHRHRTHVAAAWLFLRQTTQHFLCQRSARLESYGVTSVPAVS